MELRAKIYMQQGLPTQALACYKELVRVYPTNSGLLLALADIHGKRGECEEKLDALTRASLMCVNLVDPCSHVTLHWSSLEQHLDAH